MALTLTATRPPGLRLERPLCNSKWTGAILRARWISSKVIQQMPLNGMRVMRREIMVNSWKRKRGGACNQSATWKAPTPHSYRLWGHFALSHPADHPVIPVVGTWITNSTVFSKVQFDDQPANRLACMLDY